MPMKRWLIAYSSRRISVSAGVVIGLDMARYADSDGYEKE